MDQDTEQIRHFLPEPAFERGLNIVHPRQRKVVFHGAVQRQVEPSCHPLEHKIMGINDLGEIPRGQLNSTFKAGCIHYAIAGFNRRWLTLDVRQDCLLYTSDAADEEDS